MRKTLGYPTAFLAVIVLAALIVPRIVGTSGSRSEPTPSEMALVKGMLSHFKLDCGRYPTTDEELAALRAAPKGLEGKWGPSAYADQAVVNDSWGGPYRYEADGGGFVLTSFGEDGKPGGEDYDADLMVSG